MTPEDDGKPQAWMAGRDPARTLGVQTGVRWSDIEVSDAGTVQPQKGGMSVSPPPPDYLEEHLRPPEHGGDPVWELETDRLPPELAYRPDPLDPNRHGFIEPTRRMHLNDYASVLN